MITVIITLHLVFSFLICLTIDNLHTRYVNEHFIDFRFKELYAAIEEANKHTKHTRLLVNVFSLIFSLSGIFYINLIISLFKKR
jgi:hypothetical protein